VGSDPEEHPIVTNRWEIHSTQDYVDQMLARLGHGVIDLSNEEVRRGFALFLGEAMRQFVSSVQWDFGRAATRGVEQAARLMNEPGYYETVKVRRARGIKRNREQQEQARAEYAERQAEADKILQEGIADGTIKIFPQRKP